MPEYSEAFESAVNGVLGAGTLPATFTSLMPTFFYPTVEVEACDVA
jgi:hypothetical protein